MDFRQTYEAILKEICGAYRRILKLLDRIDEYDGAIMTLSNGRRSDSRYVCALITQKDSLIAELEAVSVYAEQKHVELENTMALSRQISSHPMYQHMGDLQRLVYYRLSTLTNKEDANNAHIVNNLNECRESYELDIKISQVPADNRHVYMFVPDKKN